MNESALKERLKVIANDKKTTLNKVWKKLLLERYLARLAYSPYQDKFVFKGGLLLANYISIHRETIDIDFLLTKLKSEINQIEKIIKEIAAIDREDGFSFLWRSVEELTQSHMEYSGFRINLNAKFGKMKDTIQIDIGVGDSVMPSKKIINPFQYKGKPLFIGEITLHVYPPETIFSEKLETIFAKGSINSRMKDYHDLIVMLREPNFLNMQQLHKSIESTFNRRGTKIQSSLQFDKDAMQGLQNLWIRHIQALGEFKEKLKLPDYIDAVIDEINGYLSNLI